MSPKFQTPRGTHDILPEASPYWRHLRSLVESLLVGFGFGQIETPIFEYQEVFTKPIGSQTDIVEKELYRVERLGGEPEEKELVLRPEYTAGIVRAYLEHGLGSLPQPVKLWYWGPVFRYDRPQKGRYRQFNQFGWEILGEASPTTDAFVILLAWQIFRQLKLEPLVVLEINTIGDKACRPKINKALTNYLVKFEKKLCPDCQRRLKTNPFRILDCRQVGCQAITKEAPNLVDLICLACHDHFRLVLEHLDDLNIPYDLNQRLVRGLDYYTKTTFEIRPVEDDGRQSSLGGGGRYDDLVELMGGASTPAIGFAGGIERIIEQKIKVPTSQPARLCVVQFGQLAKRKSLQLVADLSSLGYQTLVAFDKESLNAQLKYADKMAVQYSLIIGQKEALANEVIVRNMADGSQATISVKKLAETLKKKLKK